MTISLGDVPVVTTLVTDAAGAPTDPPTRTARFMSPTGVVTVAVPATTGTVGTIETTGPEANERGRWWYWIDFNGTADDGHYDVDPAPAAA